MNINFICGAQKGQFEFVFVLSGLFRASKKMFFEVEECGLKRTKELEIKAGKGGLDFVGCRDLLL